MREPLSAYEQELQARRAEREREREEFERLRAIVNEPPRLHDPMALYGATGEEIVAALADVKRHAIMHAEKDMEIERLWDALETIGYMKVPWAAMPKIALDALRERRIAQPGEVGRLRAAHQKIADLIPPRDLPDPYAWIAAQAKTIARRALSAEQIAREKQDN